MTFEVFSMGTAHTPFHNLTDIPRCSKDLMAEGYIEINEEFEDCLIGLENFKNIFVISWMDHADRSPHMVKPHTQKDKPPLGVFATRSPARPNPLALTLLDITKIEGRKIYVRGLDLLDGTPIIDIKKYDSVLDSP